MLSYLQSQLFLSQEQIPTVQKINKMLQDLQNDNISIEQQLSQYQQKISQLPLQIRRRILEQQQLPSQLSQNQQQHPFLNVNSNIISQQQQQQGSPHSPNIFTSIVDKNLLQQKLINLQQQEEQIDYISRLSDMYMRCKKQPQNSLVMDGTQLANQKSNLQREQLQQIAQFIKSIKPYSNQQEQQSLNSLENNLINDLISNIRLHTSKKLTQKFQNLVHYGPSGNNQKIIIQNFLIKNCKSIILGDSTNQNQSSKTSDNNAKIINKFVEKILGDVIYYDVSYQKIILMQVVDKKQSQQHNRHQQVIHRKKVYFFPTDTQKHFDSINRTLAYHIEKVNQLKALLCSSSEQSTAFSTLFDKTVEKYILQIKSNLQYILPYINIKSRKEIMSILAHGKDQVMEFEDLVLRLKFKGQDGQMFMNNLDVVFSRLLQLHLDSSDYQKERIKFNQKNFQTLTSFFELGIFQAQQSLLQSSSKAIKKLTTSFTSRNNWQKPNISTKHTSKKLFNMIFFSVSNLIERFDQLLDREGQVFGEYSEALGSTYEDKVSEWMGKLIEIREGVRKRIHEE